MSFINILVYFALLIVSQMLYHKCMGGVMSDDISLLLWPSNSLEGKVGGSTIIFAIFS